VDAVAHDGAWLETLDRACERALGELRGLTDAADARLLADIEALRVYVRGLLV
jgi:hypothetical protein